MTHGLKLRLDRLERKSGSKVGLRIFYLMPNLEAEEDQDTPYDVKITSEIRAHAAGGPFTSHEIDTLKAQYRGRKKLYESKTEN